MNDVEAIRWWLKWFHGENQMSDNWSFDSYESNERVINFISDFKAYFLESQILLILYD